MVGEWLGNRILLFIGFVMMLGVVIFAAVYSNTGNRFKKTGDDG